MKEIWIEAPLTNEQKQMLNFVEFWKQYKSTHYYLSTQGRIYNTVSKRKRFGSPTKDGYRSSSVHQIKDGTMPIHRLVYETFVGPIPNDMQIDHINDVRSDNRLANLRLVTPSQNSQKVFDEGHKTNEGKHNPMYGRHHSLKSRQKMIKSRTGKKLTALHRQHIREAQSKKVLCIETGVVYDSTKIAAKGVGSYSSNIEVYR